jgi:methylglutaconyl-CoA hydratase
VTLNRPAVRNAFNDGVIAELTEAFSTLGQREDLRVIVLAAEGKAFCAGADLNWMKAMAGYSWDENRADAARLAQMLWTIYRCPVPIVARVQGDVYAGGVGLVACADIVVSVASAGFSLSEAKLGLLPATIGPYVVKAIGERQARRYFTTAERFDAATAQRLGLVHEVADGVEALDAKVADGGAGVQAPGARPRRPAPHRVAARRHRTAHRRHPRLQRGARRGAEFSGQDGAALVVSGPGPGPCTSRRRLTRRAASARCRRSGRRGRASRG